MPVVGFEPTCLAASALKADVAANFTTPACPAEAGLSLFYHIFAALVKHGYFTSDKGKVVRET